MERFDASQFDANRIPALLEYLLEGQTLGPLLGQTVRSQESLYYLAHTFYGQGKYMEAMRMFGFLLLSDHLDRRYYSGLAACLQMQRRHRDAIKYWQIASTLDLTDPEPVMHTAECYMCLGERGPAREALDYALVQATAHEAHQRHLPRLETMLELLGAGDASEGRDPAPQDSSAVT